MAVRVQSPLLTVSIAFMACFPNVVAGADVPDARGSKVENQRIDIRFNPAPQPHTQSFTAAVKVSFQLANAGDTEDTSLRKFPMAAPRQWRLLPTRPSSTKLFVDGKPIPFKIEKLEPQADRQSHDGPSPEQRKQWADRIEAWIATDAELHRLIKRYRELAAVQSELSTLNNSFEDAVEKHLIHKELDSAALSVANNSPTFTYLVWLMPEVNPTLRIDGAFKRWKYISILNEYDPDVYRPYEEEWRKQADQWFASKPDLGPLVPKLRAAWKTMRDGQALLSGPITRHLHDVSGLSLEDTLRFKGFLQAGGSVPPVALVRSMFPDIRKSLDEQAKSQSKTLVGWGFQESTMSPFTGRLMSAAGHDRPFFKWRDETVLAALGEDPVVGDKESHRDSRPSLEPRLVSFVAPIPPQGKVAVSIEYEAQVAPMADPRSATFSFGAPQELTAVFHPAENTAVSVTIPEDNLQPIISPAPKTIEVLDDGGRRFETTLSSKQSELHLMLVQFNRFGNAFAGHFSMGGETDAADIERLIAVTDNKTVRPLLMASLSSMWLQRGNLWEAHQLRTTLEREHADFNGCLKIAFGDFRAKEAQQLADWVDAKSMSPRIETKHDERQFEAEHHGKLPPPALKELAARVQRLDTSKLDVEEKLTRHFILCQAGNQSAQQLKALLKLAEEHPEQALVSLRLLRLLSIEKSVTLPYVLKQIDPDLRAKVRARKLTTSSFEWTRQNAAYSALRTFRSAASAGRIIRFIQSTDEGLMVQGAIDAISRLSLPQHFDELAKLADKVAAASHSAFVQYLNLMLRSDKQKAVPLLDDLRKRHPKLAHYILRAHGRAGQRVELPRAIAIYAKSDDINGELTTAVSTLHDLAEPADIARLKYRKGLPEWMGERLVNVIRTKGGDSAAFPFVEAYYREHVQDKKRHNHLTCVAAFERIGDKRAILYLREIVNSTERKADAAQAIGRLTLDRQIPRISWQQDVIGQSMQTIFSLTSTEQAKNAAWAEMLKDQRSGFQRLMRHGPLHTAIHDQSPLQWSKSDRENLLFVRRFGDVAATELLQASDGCVLERRYQLARVLEILLPESRSQLESTASDSNADGDRRATAKLALELHDRQPHGE